MYVNATYSLTGLRTADLASLSRLSGRVAEKSRVCLGRTVSVTVPITYTCSHEHYHTAIGVGIQVRTHYRNLDTPIKLHRETICTLIWTLSYYMEECD